MTGHLMKENCLILFFINIINMTMMCMQEVDESPEDEWSVITASRNAKWYYSAFHNVTAMVGAGVLGLPFAMSQLGWFVLFFLFKPLYFRCFL